MCGRYFLAQSNQDQQSDELSRIIAALNRKKTPASLKTSGEIFPSDIVPVLANNRQMEIEPFAMRWGYSFPNSRPIINARSETASKKALFKDGMLQRRCLIPASNYFEWGWNDNSPRVEDDASAGGNSHMEVQTGAALQQNSNHQPNDDLQRDDSLQPDSSHQQM